MSARSLMQNLITVLIIAALFMTGFTVVKAQVMQSGSYQIQSDSVNFGGGYSSSTNYQQESTFGEVSTGISSSSNFNLYAGYQQMQEVYLALAGGGNVSMSPAINGVTGGTASGSTTVTAITDSSGGYQLTIEASDSPAMQDGANSIADYVPAGADPDRIFTTNSSDSHFAFSPFGNDVVQKFQTNGTSCNVSGTASATACWDGLSTTAEVISQTSSANHPAGTDTTIYFKVGIGPTVNQTAGTYVATSTVTLLAL